MGLRPWKQRQPRRGFSLPASVFRCLNDNILGPAFGALGAANTQKLARRTMRGAIVAWSQIRMSR